MVSQEDVLFVLNVIAGVFENLASNLLNVLGKFLSGLLNVRDDLSILDSCAGGEAVIRMLAFLFMAVTLSALFVIGLAGLPFLFIVIGVIFLTLVVDSLKSAFLRCPK